MHQVLIIGCGNIAGGFDAARAIDEPPLSHAGAFAQHPGFTVAACVEPDEARRHAFQARWQVERGAETFAALGACAAGEFAVVSICSPTASRVEHVEQALALRPRLIFCEKPLAPTSAEARAIIARCVAQGVLLAVNYTRRWDPELAKLAQEIRAGTWGPIRSITGVYTKGIVHNGGHMVDLLHMIVGETELVAAGAPCPDFWDDDPTVPALLASRSGVPITLMPGHAGDFALFELTLVTGRGTLTMLDGGARWAIRRAGDSDTFAGYRSLGKIEIADGGYDQAMRGAVANIAAALDRGVSLASGPDNAMAVQILCETIRDAALAGSASRGTRQ